MHPLVRDAVCSDAPGIAAVHVASWRTTYAGIVPDTYLANLSVARRQPMWDQLLCSGSQRVVVLVAEDAISAGIIGFASAGPTQTPDPVYPFELYTIYLLAEQQRQGTGHRLVQAAVERMQQRGVPAFLLWVLAANLPARRFYEGLGGQVVREQAITIGGMELVEVAYGWNNLPALLRRFTEGNASTNS